MTSRPAYTDDRPLRAVGSQAVERGNVLLHGRRLGYVTAGTCPTVVLLHGLGGSTETWRRVVPSLSTSRRVVALDLLGHGRSDKPRCGYSSERWPTWSGTPVTSST